jgi:hypothetical protein
MQYLDFPRINIIAMAKSLTEPDLSSWADRALVKNFQI